VRGAGAREDEDLWALEREKASRRDAEDAEERRIRTSNIEHRTLNIEVERL
jgi:hypothetical protein